MVAGPELPIEFGSLTSSDRPPPNPSIKGTAIGCIMVSTDQFRQEIRSRLDQADAQGRRDLTIECGELYWSVSKLPIFDPWMIFCCNAMRAEMAHTDNLIFDDGKESLLTVQYGLPRNQNRPPLKSN
jgi:hypothetical protein